MSELIETGSTKMRLPFWNKHAYAVPRPEGPWADIFDVTAGVGGGDPIPRLIIECDQDDRWEAIA